LGCDPVAVVSLHVYRIYY